MNELIYLGGARGTGKSTLLKYFLEQRPENIIFEYGERMRLRAKDEGLIKTDSDFSHLNSKIIKGLRSLVKTDLIDLQSSNYRDIFVSGHYAISQKNQLVSTFDYEKTSGSIYDQFVLVETDSDVLEERINRDSKFRELTKREDLEKYRLFAKEVGEKIAESNNKELIIIKNNNFDDGLEELIKYFG